MAEKSRPTKGATASSADDGTPAEVVATQAPRRSEGPRARPRNGLDRYFSITARRSTVGRELRGGVTPCFTMAYSVGLTPITLSAADVTGAKLPFPGVAATTALVAGVMT